MMIVLAATSLLALFFSVWELSWNLKEDLLFIWGSPFQWSLQVVIKILFISSRYSPLLILPGNVIAAFTFGREYPFMSVESCRKMMMYQTIVTNYVLLVFNMIMMVKLYGLYNLSKRTAFIMAIFIAGFIARATLALVTFVPKQEFTGTCMISSISSDPQSQHAVFTFVISEFTTQLGLVALIFGRTANLKMRALREPANVLQLISPVLKRFMQDGWIMFILAAVFLGAVMFFNFGMDVVNNKRMGDSSQVVLPILIAVLSSFGCRLTLNLRNTDLNGSHTSDIELDSVVSDVNSLEVVDPWRVEIEL